MRGLGLAALMVTVAGCGAKTGIATESEDAAAPVPPDAAPDACVELPEVAIEECVLDGPTSTVRGTTPLGPVDLAYAWAGYIEACNGGNLQLGSRERLTGVVGRPFLPWLYVAPLPETPSSLEVGVTLRAPGCRSVTTTGWVEVTVPHGAPGDDPRGSAGRPDGFCACDGTGGVDPPCPITGDKQPVVATLRVLGEGWDLSGEVRAHQCHEMHGICL